jgi:hypothetical protein
MSEIKDGGPAFPVPMEDRHCGMTLRDYFAAKAMQGLVAGSGPEAEYQEAVVASSAYTMADAMIAARES